MAKVKLNPILEQIRGNVGDLVFKRYGDEVLIAKKPDMSDRELSPAQLAAQERFRQAAMYGKMVMADPETKALYTEAARVKGKPVFSLTVADFFNAPSVDEFDISAYTGTEGDEIAIMARDDFGVIAVHIEITDGDGNAIESGAAVETPADSGRWIYTVTANVGTGTDVRIAVTVSDRPGGVGEAQSEKTI
ncbi:MAG: hypothetical protein H8D34_32980 [Chloroflexi bacterium]|nr:hypothetical protein [Chloroflexota bacterium]